MDPEKLHSTRLKSTNHLYPCNKTVPLSIKELPSDLLCGLPYGKTLLFSY